MGGHGDGDGMGRGELCICGFDVPANSATIALPMGCVAPVTTQMKPYYLGGQSRQLPTPTSFYLRWFLLTSFPSALYGEKCSESNCAALFPVSFSLWICSAMIPIAIDVGVVSHCSLGWIGMFTTDHVSFSFSFCFDAQGFG